MEACSGEVDEISEYLYFNNKVNISRNVAHHDDDIILGLWVPVHADDLHPGAHAPGEGEGVVLLEDRVEGALDGGGLLGGVARHLHPEVGVCLVQHPVSVGKVLGFENGGEGLNGTELCRKWVKIEEQI